MQDSVSVVVPTYNQATYLTETLHGILAQTLPATEIIVVNDGSTDCTEEVLDRYKAYLSVITTENLGVSTARNIGLERVRSKYVAFCDSDDVWHPEKLATQLEHLARRSPSKWCLCAVALVNEIGELVGEVRDGTEGWVFERIIGLKPNTVMGGGSGILVETQLAEAVGGFDPSLSTSADWEFYARLSMISPLAFVRKPLVRYRLHQAGMHMNLEHWDADMTQALAAIEQRGLISRGTLRRSRATLDMQIAGEFWRRGARSPAIGRALTGLGRSPQAFLTAAYRRLGAA